MYVTLHSTPNCYPLPSTTPVKKFSVAAHCCCLTCHVKSLIFTSQCTLGAVFLAVAVSVHYLC